MQHTTRNNGPIAIVGLAQIWKAKPILKNVNDIPAVEASKAARGIHLFIAATNGREKIWSTPVAIHAKIPAYQ